jgi:hypothetical protein
VAARVTLFAVAAAVASLPVPGAIAQEPPTRPGRAPLAARKDRAPAGGAAGPVTTLATLVDVHGRDAVVLDDAAPTDRRFAELLRDRVTGAHTRLDPRLIGLIREVATKTGTPKIELVSGYRSPKLNEMLRKKEHKVASHSQHSLGHAVDFRVEGLGPADTKKLVVALGWAGGIGQYDAAHNLFVHADVGRKRFWHER